jgi:hypothetical protein
MFERKEIYAMEQEPDDETKAREVLKQGKLNCRFCKKVFETKNLLEEHCKDWKDCISLATREYILFN